VCEEERVLHPRRTEEHKRRRKNRMKRTPQIHCKDGAYLSVQVSQYHYSEPREDVGPYTLVEVGYPSCVPLEFLSYAEEKENPTETIYGYVPIELVEEFIQNHGGIDLGKSL
jgi:hypothetical protein